ncbi:MAG TPA: acyl-CoA thioesterase [Pseudomonadota bacterium]|jgi:acyl-CoA hydrolase|nr:acyl-CoA thioesterase [Pseudomonadota bacterium]
MIMKLLSSASFSSSGPLLPRSAQDSVTEMTEYVLPQHANAIGNVFGGQILSWMDLCAAITAQRHTGRLAVTAFVDDILFKHPVSVGEVVHLRAQVTATFHSSLEIEVNVHGEDPFTRRQWPCLHAFLTFVCIDVETRKPIPTPPLLLDTEEAKRSQAEGTRRREQRLASKPETDKTQNTQSPQTPKNP